uniref:Uncharacterized protein n=1 Tax=Arundo donax TaxID=35708 RepID=A0A0A8YB90_ARUDO
MWIPSFKWDAQARTPEPAESMELEKHSGR